MRLTLWTDYALRTLIYTAARGEELSTIRDIAETFDVPKTHLMKIVQRLAQQGYLETIRGRGGGIRLARAAEDIRVGAVVRDTEEELAVVGCLSETGFCRIERCCVLQSALREATEAFLGVLDRYTLADLASPRAALGALLGIAPSDAAYSRRSEERTIA